MKSILAVLACAAALALAGCQKSHSMSSSQEPALGEASTVAHTATLWVKGMACPQCAYNVDLQLLKVPGVESVKVEMNSGRVLATLSPTSPPTSEQLAEAIKNTGFTLVRIDMPPDGSGSSKS